MNADLYWILNTPSMMRAPAGIQDWTWLCEQFSSEPAFPGSSVVSENKRLGLYYENLVFEILSKTLKNNKLKRNIQVKSNKITVGEFDFVGSAPFGDFHLECAVKFYLRVGSGASLSHFIGPGKKDRLDIKWARLLQHQLPLSDTEAGREQLIKLGLAPSTKALLLQGYLFHPLSDPDPVELAAEINPNHLAGWWVKPSQMNLLDNNSRYAVLEKPYWLSPKVESAVCITQLSTLAANYGFPQLISRGNWLNGKWQEIDRGFIVPEAW